DREIVQDLGGGSRIPTISERQARSLAELRAAGVGVRRVGMLHDGTPAGSDPFRAGLTMLDPDVYLTPAFPQAQGDLPRALAADVERAERIDRPVATTALDGDPLASAAALARKESADLVIVPAPADGRVPAALRDAPCPVFLAALPNVSLDVAAAE